MYDSVRRVGRSTHGRSSTNDHDRGVLGGVDEEVAGGQGDGERLDGLVDALDRQGGPRRADARAGGEPVDAVEQAVEQPGQARPGQLDLGLDAAQAHDPAVAAGRRGSAPPASSSDRRLADARLADDRQRPALADRRRRRPGRRWRRRRPGGRAATSAGVGGRRGRRSWRSGGARGLPDAGTIRSRANISDRILGASTELPDRMERSRHGRGSPTGRRTGSLAGPLAGRRPRTGGGAPARPARAGRGAARRRARLRTTLGRRRGPGADRRHRPAGARRRAARRPTRRGRCGVADATDVRGDGRRAASMPFRTAAVTSSSTSTTRHVDAPACGPQHRLTSWAGRPTTSAARRAAGARGRAGGSARGDARRS